MALLLLPVGGECLENLSLIVGPVSASKKGLVLKHLDLLLADNTQSPIVCPHLARSHDCNNHQHYKAFTAVHCYRLGEVDPTRSCLKSWLSLSLTSTLTLTSSPTLTLSSTDAGRLSSSHCSYLRVTMMGDPSQVPRQTRNFPSGSPQFILLTGMMLSFIAHRDDDDDSD